MFYLEVLHLFDLTLLILPDHVYSLVLLKHELIHSSDLK